MARDWRANVCLLCGKLPAVRNEFIKAILNNQKAFRLDLAADAIERLADYYEIVQQHNPLLHLVAPSSPEEFAIRHILESLTLLEFLPEGTCFADVGSGAGLPSIPCLLARKDLQAVLIESKLKKAGFLQMVFAKCKLEKRAAIINRQFTEVTRPDVFYVSCRALDKFSEKLPKLIKWSGNCTLLLFGGPGLRTKLKELGRSFREKLLPMSEQRFLFISEGR
jgi:16S rRNA (guanine(527)-N(7))-methyltransferase RsmG